MINIKEYALLALVLTLPACNEKPKSTKSPAEIDGDTQKEYLAATTKTRAFDVNGNQMLVVSTPIKSYFGVEYQTCFIWRDKEYKTASMHCGQQPEMDLSNLGGRESE